MSEMPRDNPIGDAWHRVIERAHGHEGSIAYTSEPTFRERAERELRDSTTYDLLGEYGLVGEDVQSFCSGGVDAIAAAVLNGTPWEHVATSVICTALLTGIELARDAR